MRLVCKVYRDPANGGDEIVVFETDEKGENRRVIAGTRPPPGAIRRVPVYVEVSCDNSSEAINKTLEVLKGLETQLEERKGR